MLSDYPRRTLRTGQTNLRRWNRRNWRPRNRSQRKQIHSQQSHRSSKPISYRRPLYHRSHQPHAFRDGAQSTGNTPIRTHHAGLGGKERFFSSLYILVLDDASSIYHKRKNLVHGRLHTSHDSYCLLLNLCQSIARRGTGGNQALRDAGILSLLLPQLVRTSRGNVTDEQVRGQLSSYQKEMIPRAFKRVKASEEGHDLFDTDHFGGKVKFWMRISITRVINYLALAASLFTSFFHGKRQGLVE
jgi:hypothetical protein